MEQEEIRKTGSHEMYERGDNVVCFMINIQIKAESTRIRAYFYEQFCRLFQGRSTSEELHSLCGLGILEKDYKHNFSRKALKAA